MRNVLQYEEALDIDFGQASICLDACLILAFLDSDDVRGDAVGNMLAKWKEDGVEKIGIPSQVHNEVIHNLFKNIVLKALVSAKKYQLNMDKRKQQKYNLTFEEKSLGEMRVSQDLLRFSPKQPIIDILQGRRVQIPISNILKEYKKTLPELRTSLTTFYSSALHTMHQFINTLSSDFGFRVDFLEINQDSINLAESYMRLFQLEIFDAMHLASSQYNYYHYFATLDKDFVHNLYQTNNISIKILNIA